MKWSLPILLVVTVFATEQAWAQNSRSLATARRISAATTVILPAIGITAALMSEKKQNWGVASYGGAAIGGLGLFYGPSSGHAYAGSASRFFTWSSLRILAFSGLAVSVYMLSGEALGDHPEDKGLQILSGIGLGAASVSLLVVTIVTDFRSLRISVDEYNRRHEFSSMYLRPVFSPQLKTIGLDVVISI